MIINTSKSLNFSHNVNHFINLYKRKILVLKMVVSITNIVFPTIALFLVIISTLNIAGKGYETSITGSNYIIFSALISGIIALINSLISFFLLKEKISRYNGIYYQLIIEKQRYELNGDKYQNIKEKTEKNNLYENELFFIITGYQKENTGVS